MIAGSFSVCKKLFAAVLWPLTLSERKTATRCECRKVSLITSYFSFEFSIRCREDKWWELGIWSINWAMLIWLSKRLYLSVITGRVLSFLSTLYFHDAALRSLLSYSILCCAAYNVLNCIQHCGIWWLNNEPVGSSSCACFAVHAQRWQIV